MFRPLKYCRSLITKLFFTTSGICMDKLSNCHDYGLDVCTKYRLWADENCPRYCAFCQGWFSGFLFIQDILFMGLFFKVTPQLTICINYMPINYVSAKVHFCLVKYKYILTSQGSLIRTSPHKGSGMDRKPLLRKDVCEGAQNS